MINMMGSINPRRKIYPIIMKIMMILKQKSDDGMRREVFIYSQS